MKQFILLFTCAILFQGLHAQTLYGTSLLGGAYNSGTITKLETATNSLTSVFDFESGFDGQNPQYLKMVEASDGILYGTTKNGGSTYNGTIFSYDPATGTYAKLHDFDYFEGSTPIGSLMQASDGKLYGLTSFGGDLGDGTLYSFDPVTAVYVKLWNFTNQNGAYPFGSLMQASDGKLYGVTYFGGVSGFGTLFSFDLTTSTFSKLYDFNYSSGRHPQCTLLERGDGKLYGLTTNGGIYNQGALFSFDPATSDYTKLADFDENTGTFPQGSLIEANDGKLYSMAVNGGSNNLGTIFNYDPINSTIANVFDFDLPHGSLPYGSLIQATDGNLYGMTAYGGSEGYGTVFSYDISTTTCVTKKNFTGHDGSSPFGSLLQASDGKLYGGTQYTLADNGYGVLFSLDISTSMYAQLQIFGSNTTGSFSYNELASNGSGTFYGMTSMGGEYGMGVIYSFEPETQAFTKLYSFDGINGSSPYSKLTLATNGKFYGTTISGGTINNAGTLFSFDPATNTFAKLYDFDELTGYYPISSLLQASDGKLYGMCIFGGPSGHGTLYSLDPATNSFTYILEFNDINGFYPEGTLIQASDGKLYGTATTGGSASNGTLFSYELGTTTYNKVHDFDFYDGRTPLCNLLQASDGLLYGLAPYGGNSGLGTLFSFDPATTFFSKLHDFDNMNGYSPISSLMQASDGKLYSYTAYGGSNDIGVAFSYDLASSGYTKLADYDGINGTNPLLGSFIEKTCTTATTYFLDADGDGYGDANNSTIACDQPDGYVTDNTDCNDADANIHAPVTYYLDADGDGYGNASMPTDECSLTAPDGYVANSTDCDDADAATHPGAMEVRDGKDNDCDGYIDEGFPLPKVRINNVGQYEGNAGQTAFVFTVYLNVKPVQTVMVNFATSNKTATAPSDYLASSGTLSFAPGEKSKQLTIMVNGDLIKENDEYFKVILSNPVNATIADALGIGGIGNDDVNATNNDDSRTGMPSLVTTQNSFNTPTLLVSPNPANSIVQVQASGFSGRIHLQLLDAKGNVLRKSVLQGDGGKHITQQFAVATLASGSYFIVAKDEAGVTLTKQVLVSH